MKCKICDTHWVATTSNEEISYVHINMIWHALGGKMLPILRTLNLSAYLIS